MVEIKTVAIIGGGASGVLVCLNLLKNCKTPLKIVVINSGGKLVTGLAYHLDAGNNLLNVMSSKMSAFQDDPDHFMRWLTTQKSVKGVISKPLAESYVPRKMFGEYLKSVWEKALTQKSEAIEVKVIHNHALGIKKRSYGSFTINLNGGKEIDGDYVILATGNVLPRNPPILNLSFYQSKKYFNNPWLPSFVENLDFAKDIFIIGNGLTMADTVLSLMEKKYDGVIYSLSPNGFRILPHEHPNIPYDDLIKELNDPKSLYQMMKLVNKHIKTIKKLGLKPEAVIDSLRPLTQSLWLGFSHDEKKQFISRIRHLWGVARHRLPAQSYEIIEKMKNARKLVIYAGYVVDMTEENGSCRIEFFEKKTKTVQSISVGRVINCTGPEVDIQKMDDILFKNLIKSNLISPDPLNMGIEADPRTLQVLNGEHERDDSFFAIGSLLRGLLWESTAIPEIRSQAKNIADQIISKEKFRHQIIQNDSWHN
jgi:uncharacterized NAD(P)/FAD-binding protein YdhS